MIVYSVRGRNSTDNTHENQINIASSDSWHSVSSTFLRYGKMLGTTFPIARKWCGKWSGMQSCESHNLTNGKRENVKRRTWKTQWNERERARCALQRVWTMKLSCMNVWKTREYISTYLPTHQVPLVDCSKLIYPLYHVGRGILSICRLLNMVALRWNCIP